MLDPLEDRGGQSRAGSSEGGTESGSATWRSRMETCAQGTQLQDEQGTPKSRPHGSKQETMERCKCCDYNKKSSQFIVLCTLFQNLAIQS